MLKRKFPKFIYFLVSFLLIFEQSGFAQVAGELDLSVHFSRLTSSFTQDKFRPPHLRYISYDNLSNSFKLLLEKGNQFSQNTVIASDRRERSNLQSETKILLNYFFIGISLPNSSFWVNLRPDQENNIIDPEVEKTDLGKILLEADLQLKQDTANFTSPQTPEGKAYWDKLYSKAGELFGSENITIPTLTRPWIVPGEIIIRETSDNAYIYKATLKVMLESDYLNSTIATNAAYQFKDERLKQLNEYSSQLIRELIIPKLTKDVNISKRYAPLRQVYYSLILAQWFKQKFYGKGGLYSYLIDKRNLTGLTSKEPWSKTNYFQAYQKSFREGEYNIKEQVHSLGAQTIRNYMSGGIVVGGDSITEAIKSGGRIVGSPFKSVTTLNPKVILGQVQGGTIQKPYSGEVNIEFKDEPIPPEKSVSYSASEVSISPDVSVLKQTSSPLRLAKFMQLAKSIFVRVFQSAWAYPAVILLTWLWGELGSQGITRHPYNRLENMTYTIPIVYVARYIITQTSQYRELSKNIPLFQNTSKFLQEANWKKVLLLFVSITFSSFAVSRLGGAHFAFPRGSLLYKIDHYWLNDFMNFPAIATGIYSVTGTINLGLRAVKNIAIALKLIKPESLMKSVFYILGIIAVSSTYYFGLRDLLYNVLTELYQDGSPLHLAINTRALVLGTFDYGDLVAYATGYIIMHYLTKYFYGSNELGKINVPAEASLEDEAVTKEAASTEEQLIGKPGTRNRELSEWKFYTGVFTAMFIVGFAPFLVAEYFSPGIVDNFSHSSNLGAFISAAFTVLWTHLITPIVSFMGVYFGYEQWQEFITPKAIAEKKSHVSQSSGSSSTSSPLDAGDEPLISLTNDPTVASSPAAQTTKSSSAVIDEDKVKDILLKLGLTIKDALEGDASILYMKIKSSNVISDNDLLLLFDFLWSRKGIEGLFMPDSLKKKLIENRNEAMYSGFYLAKGHVEPLTIIALKKQFQLSTEETRFLWTVFHKKNSYLSNRSLKKILKESPAIKRIVGETIKSKKGKGERAKVLDLGCGPTGRAIKALKRAYPNQMDAWGIDMEITDHSGPNIHLREGIIEELPFNSDYFDIIYEYGVMEYVVDDEELVNVLSEIMRVLSPGGKFVFTDTIGYTLKQIKLALDKLDVVYKIYDAEGRILVLDDYSGDLIIEKASNIINNKGKNNPSTGSPVTLKADINNPGGIDLRALPIATQQAPVGISASSSRRVAPISLTQLNNEWRQIENMLNADIIPSTDRIKNYLIAACVSSAVHQETDKVLICLAGIMIRDEERVENTEPALKEILSLLESDKPANEMQLALAKITVLAKEPAKELKND